MTPAEVIVGIALPIASASGAAVVMQDQGTGITPWQIVVLLSLAALVGVFARWLMNRQDRVDEREGKRWDALFAQAETRDNLLQAQVARMERMNDSMDEMTRLLRTLNDKMSKDT